jgi:hypothetical protein
MKFNKTRLGTVVYNKVDGNKYKVSKVNANVAFAVEILTDEEIAQNVQPKCVMINEGNALAFRYLSDTEPLPIPTGYTVEEGILLKDGEPATEQGQIVVKDIITVQSGTVILTALTRDREKGKVDLLAYMPSNDKFKKLASRIPDSVKLVKEINGSAVMVYSETVEKEVEENGEKVTKTFPTGSEVFFIKDGVINGSRDIKNAINVDDIVLVDTECMITAFVSTNYKVRDDESIEKADYTYWYMAESGPFTDVNEGDSDFEMAGPIKVDASPLYGLVIRNDSEIFVPSADFRMKMNPGLMSKLDGYDILIDISKEGYEYKLTFANSNYELRTVTSKSTKDRGYIVTIQ